jgi:predicted amidohydrolase YtcJ
MKKNWYYLILIPGIMSMTSCHRKQYADLIIYNGHLRTLDEHDIIAGSMAVKDGRIIAIGNNNEILDKFEGSVMLDCQGKTLLPGFIDSHCHFYNYGLTRCTRDDLRGTRSFQEVLDRITAWQKQHPADWIQGRGWDQNDWEVKQFPDRRELDSLFPMNPVVLIRIDGHAALVNGEALKRAGIKAQTKVEGGIIEVKNGVPTGILIDNAIDLVTDSIPAPGRDLQIRSLLTAQQACFKYGLTMVVDAGLKNAVVNLIDSLQRHGQLKMRVDAMLLPLENNIRQYINQGIYQTDRLRVGSIKCYVDGSLGSRSAALLQPYSDDPGNYGLMLHEPHYYDSLCEKAYAAGYQMNTHAIGDSAVRFILHTYAAVLGGPNDRRWRIEHSQVVDPGDIDLYGRYNIIPSIQSTHATSDMYWAGDRLGKERLRHAYTYHDLLRQNGWLVNGTDFPVEEINPVFTFYAAVIRKDLQGFPPGGFQMGNALSRDEAIKSMTLWAAKGSFRENELGSLQVNKFADFVILDKDIMTIPEDEIPSVTVLKTFLNGEEVYDAGILR